MANSASFIMKVVGEQQNVSEFERLIVPAKGGTLGRVYHAETKSVAPGSVEISGTCAWTVRSAFTINKNTADKEFVLESLSEKLGLKIEYYQTELGAAFQGYSLIVNGKVIEDSSVDYYEYFTEDFDSVEELNAHHNTHFTEEDFNRLVIQVGGYHEYGCFSI